jgi:hypothetical protein
MNIKGILGLFIEPVASIFRKREERKLAKVQVEGKLAEARQNNDAQVTFNDQELEVVLAQQKQHSWVDEYATVSVLSVFNLIVIGGIAAAFGHTEILAGIGIAVTSLVNAGVDVGFLLEAVTLSAVGLSVWRKI